MVNKRSRIVKRREQRRQTGVLGGDGLLQSTGDAVGDAAGAVGGAVGEAGDVVGDAGEAALEGTEDALGYVGGGTENVLRDIGGLGRDTLAVLPGIRTTREQRAVEERQRQEVEENEGGGSGVGSVLGDGGDIILIAGAAIGVAGLVYYATQAQSDSSNKGR